MLAWSFLVWGADGLVTDRPGLAVRVREEPEGMTAVSRLLLRFGLALAQEEGGPGEPGDP